MEHALPAHGRRASRCAAGILVAATLARAPRARAADATATLPGSAAPSFVAPVAAAGPLPRIDARGGAVVAPRLVQGAATGAMLGPRRGEPETIAADFARRRLAPAGTLEHVSTVTGGGGVRFVTLEQRFDGVPVPLGRVTVAVGPDGSVVAARVGELAPAAPPAPSGRAVVAGAAEARRLALEALDQADSAGDSAGDFVGEARAERVVIPLAGTSTWGWRVQLGRPGRPEERYDVLLAEADGRVLRREGITFPGIDAARVFPRSPLQPAAWKSFPDPARRPSVDSPRGWCDADQTAGNNTWVQLDREGDFFPPFGASATASGNPPVLDFPFTGDPARDVDLALTNVFWAINDSHDRFRRLGFDEASGAMQDDGYGRGGSGSDRVWALVQYATQDGTQPYANVGLGTGPDGSFTYMVVGVFDTGAGLRDGALDTSLLVHEYAHGVSTRLAGDDPACFGGVQPQALSEGWSDFFAASFTGDPVIGAWSSANATSGQRQTSLDANPFTFSNLCADGCNRFNDGEIWSGALWDLRHELVRSLGPAAGVDKAERLVVEGLRYTPCRATFPEARDAILLADAALFAGADRCTLWSVLANRGVGWSAQTSGPDDARPLAAYDLPPECSGGQAAWFDQDEYATDAAATVSVVDGGGVAGTTVTVRTARGDSVTAPLVPAGSGPLRRASFLLVPGPVVAGDGLLQVTGSDTLTATCDGPGTTAGARVSDGIPLTVVSHYVYSAWCQDPGRDDDHPDGWYNLSGFLDAGEIANVVVTLGSGTGADVQDASVLVTSLNPDVRVLPSVPQPVGTIERQRGTAPRPFTFEFRAEGSPRIVPGETADVRFDVAGRGRSGSVTLRMTLDEDYVVVAGVSPFDGGVETFEPSSSTAGAWTHQPWRGVLDEWRIDGCAGNGPSPGCEVAQAPCLPYVDGQVATALVSPPAVPLPPDAVGSPGTELEFAL